MPNNYVTRLITEEALASAKEYPIINISGPRQSGKTTLARHLFDYLPYYNLESPDVRDMISGDTRSFIRQNQGGAILDEIQRAPELMSYLQATVDENKKCKFVLTGSNQFSMLEKVTQSLAGRTVILKLLPFCISEISAVKPGLSADDLIFMGSLPSIHAEGRQPTRTYRNYYETYVERDVRNLINIKDISLFRKFLKLCAGRTGQIFNASQLATETGISVNTIKSWISVLETSFIIYLLPPWYDNINKRLIKSPKMYFYDIGLAAYLLGLTSPEQVQRDPLRGGLFENLVLNEIIKKYFNSGLEPAMYFYRDKHGNEVDALLKVAHELIPIEVKSSETFRNEFYKSLDYFRKIYQDRVRRSFLVYAGDLEQISDNYSLVNFRNFYNQVDVK
jgi:predicted AAA+ superfamily ATPase